MITVRVKLTFPESLVRTPVPPRGMVREFDVEPNIRRAKRRGALGVDHLRAGWATPGHIDAAVAWLRTEGSGSTCSADVLES